MARPCAEIGAAREIGINTVDKAPKPRDSVITFNRTDTIAVVCSQLFVVSDFLSDANRQAGATIARVAFLNSGLEVPWIASVPVKRIKTSVHQIIEFDAKTRAPCLAEPACGDERQIGGGKLKVTFKISVHGGLFHGIDITQVFGAPDICRGHRRSGANHDLRTERRKIGYLWRECVTAGDDPILRTERRR